jgi:RNA polymerase sigma-70 factor (ECF subfamily)
MLDFSDLRFVRNSSNAFMDSTDSFVDLVRRLKTGDDALVNELFQRYARRLIGLARTHLDGKLRQKVDPEDVVQSVYKSFFRRLEADQVEMIDWDSLWYFLTVMTLRKCAGQAEHYQAGRRDVRREAATQENDSKASWRAVIDREPTPDEAVILTETVEHTMRDFDPEDRAVVVLSLQGYSVREISLQLKRADRSVRRLRERVRKRLEQMIAESAKE